MKKDDDAPQTSAPTPDSAPAAGSVPDDPPPPPSVKWITHLLFLAMFALALGVFFVPRADPDRAPGGELTDFEGNEVALESRMADVTLVHFWATWCPPCIAEVPSIRRLEADLAGEPFSLLMIAVADDKEKAREFLGDDETLFDPQWDLAHDYGTTKLPETHLVVDGKVVESFVGAQDWDRLEIRKRIRQALDSV